MPEPHDTRPAEEPAPDNEDAPTVGVVEELDGSQSWMGITAFVTGALGLSVVAIVLGHLGVVAARRGRATARGFAVAGTILGYAGLVITLAFVWLGVRGPSPATVDAYAHHDVVEVGNAVADAVAGGAYGDGALPSVEAGDDGYLVGTREVDGLVATQRTVMITPAAGGRWCLQLDYVGGNETSWSFESDAGVTAGGTCAVQ